MKPGPSRRRFLTLVAAAAATPFAAKADTTTYRWRGVALGAQASMELRGIEPGPAAKIAAAVEAEVSRLESIFSLYRRDSALVRLNEAGDLPNPPPELLELLGICDFLHQQSGGAFDPSIQPLWRAHAQAVIEQRRASQGELTQARKLCDWKAVAFDTGAVSFERSGMALTLNGIAQGYVADRVAALLRARGLDRVLIDMGEIAAIGQADTGRSWRAGIATPDGEIVGQAELADRALATSAPSGASIGAASLENHILDPRAAGIGPQWRLVSISAKRATMADGLSTTACLLDRREIDDLLTLHPDARLEALV